MTILKQNADRLLNQLERSTQWPPKADLTLLEEVYKYAWFREADATRLKAAHPGGWDDDKNYIVDPLASRIAEAFADLQFGEEPDFIAGKKADQSRFEDLVRENSLPSELQQAAELQVSEGEVWWRVRVEKDASDWPIVEFHSRTNVVPLFRGRHLIAVAFISVIEDDERAWRYVECHAEGVIINRLFSIPQGQVNSTRYTGSIVPQTLQVGRPFGDPVPLTDRFETEDLEPLIEHDGPIMAGRVLNKRGRNSRVGLSQFARVKDLLFSLNEATTIGQDNMKLTARKRVVVDESVLQPLVAPDGSGIELTQAPLFNSQENVLVAGAMDENLDSKQGPFKVLEYSFDAQAMVVWDDHLVEKILVRTRTAPALVGRHTEGAQTGPALRARLLDSNLAANGKARFWDDEVPGICRALQYMDQLKTNRGGFGRTWNDWTAKPHMKRKSIIPEDPKDKTDRHATAMGAEIESSYTAIADIHPEWDDAQIKEEQRRIREDRREDLPDPGERTDLPDPGEKNGERNIDPATGEARA